MTKTPSGVASVATTTAISVAAISISLPRATAFAWMLLRSTLGAIKINPDIAVALFSKGCAAAQAALNFPEDHATDPKDDQNFIKLKIIHFGFTPVQANV